MSAPPKPLGYAKRLTPYKNKGRCGIKEKPDEPATVASKVADLAELVMDADTVVFHTGAGISTSAGIPDFRGVEGIWTREKRGHPLPDHEACWNNAVPTFAHLAIAKMVEMDLAHFVVSQNIDCLHLRSGLSRERISELHGNMFMEECEDCETEFVRSVDIGGVGLKPTGRFCVNCGGVLYDKLLDWEDSLPDWDYEQAKKYSSMCRKGGLSICLGTSMQMVPARNLPCRAKRMAIVNLQPTLRDKNATVVIRARIDEVMAQLLKTLPKHFPRMDHDVVAHVKISLDFAVAGEAGGTPVRVTFSDIDDLPLGILSSVRNVGIGDSEVDVDLEQPPFSVNLMFSMLERRQSKAAQDAIEHETVLADGVSESTARVQGLSELCTERPEM